ncbi:MAG: TonB-dependent receptor [Bacteroidales bacterium]|nr:TonB-dependent receptor [Lentimicrobiaceae bacterium]MDD5695983.1 TonB-dependent receptor [Bacteroidales bacterium]
MGNGLYAQSLTQTIKGRVTDSEIRVPLPGATVVVLGTDPLMGTATDLDGNFRIEHVPLGRYDLRISYTGYEPYVVSELVVGSGKEVIIQAGLKESVVTLGEVEVTAGAFKKEPVNSMSMISARQINMEEARRFAGGFDDPSHLAASYAGVADNMNSNGIVIRGNAPKGLLWRMEGLEISNPSHFANMTSFGGGGITSLSAQMLGASDFYTGAFPAEFGNALSGVFDLRLRTGNQDHHEHTVQIGLTGIDLSSEGPFKKGNPSSYLVNYRYSLFALLAPILPENAGGIKYQDLSFKLDFPTRKAGTFALWGIGSTDVSGTQAQKEPENWEYTEDQLTGEGRPYMGALGFTHKLIIGRRSFLNSSLAISGEGIDMKYDKMDIHQVDHPYQNIQNSSWKYSLSSYLNKKFSAKHTNRTGFTVHLLNYDMLIQQASDSTDALISTVDDQGSSMLMQLFTQSRFDLSEKWTVNVGLHSQIFTLNHHYTLEPRLGLKWKLSPHHSLSLAYGSHSRLEMLFIYLVRRPGAHGGTEPNRNLDFTKSCHLVTGYDYAINENLNFRAEAFYQHLTSVPVVPGTSTSLLNLDQDWFIDDSLTSDGTGKNYGLDLTLERYMNDGFYYIVTASVFKSRYVGGDDIRRDARYDKSGVINFVGGKEWHVGRGQKNNTLGLNGKFSIIGGDRISPVDEEATHLAQKVIYDETRAYEDRKPNVYYLHVTLNYRKNKPHHASIWSFQLLNALGSPEFFGYKYNYKNGTIDKDQQTIIMPNISYKIEF